MKKLNKQQEKEFGEHQEQLSEKFAELEAAIDAFNTAKDAAWSTFLEKLETYNNAVATANDFRQGIHDAMNEYYDEKSEKWQEADAGSSYQEWMGEWTNEFEEVEMDEPESIDAIDGIFDEFSSLPTEPT